MLVRNSFIVKFAHSQSTMNETKIVFIFDIYMYTKVF